MSSKVHPLIPEAQDLLRQGKLSRRDFIRIATLLGASVAGASAMAACGGAAPAPAPAAAPAQPTAAPVATAAPTTPPKPSIIRGGSITARGRVDRADHPARFSLVSQSHPWRHVFDYLTYTNAQGVTTPYLLDKWQASDDLKTWTLSLKKGIKFSDGKEFKADDVVFNFGQWLNKDIGSALLGLMSYLPATGVEKVDDYTVKLNLKDPTLFVPEHLFHYAAAILPATFGGDITRAPIGTGAFTMKEDAPGERCRLVKREGYWRNGEDGSPLPYLDEIVFVQLGDDPAAWLTALKSGQVEMIVEPPVTVWEGVKDDSAYNIVSTPTSATRVLRVRVDQDPWKDNKVRTALKYCHNREKILALALRNQGVVGADCHASQAQADYVPIEPFPFDTAKSLSLLKEAGVTTPVKVELNVATDWPESMAYAQALKEDAAAGGFDITLKTMPASQYWDGWTDFNMGITWWSHRALVPMTLPQAYTADADGKPVPWNESRWVDEEFSKILKQAEATLDLAKRKELVGQLETIQKERGSICTPFFMNVWQVYKKNIHGVEPSPEEFCILHSAWKEKA